MDQGRITVLGDSNRKNSRKFLDSFNETERFLRRITGSGPEKSFRQLIVQASAVQPGVRRFANDLRELADLRNAIVHQSKGDAIAEPHVSTCRLLDQIVKLLMDPPRVMPRFQREVVTVDTDCAIAEVVSEAFKRSFSQFPVNRGGSFVGIVTTNTIVRWLGANASEDIFSLEDSTVEDVLDYTEFTNNYEFVSRDSDLLSVIDLFQNRDQTGSRLDSVLISQNGKQSEKILGIISPWDLAEIHSALELS